MTDELEQQIIDNNIEITKLLRANEDLLKSAGFDPPVENYSVKGNSKIQFPNGYIRTISEFINLYHLSEIIFDNDRRKNTAYSLQLSDFYNFLINRFYIWGSVETMFLKSAIINLVSIIEVLILECANNICETPSDCDNIETCKYHLNQKQRNQIKEAVEKLKELKIIELKKAEINILYKAIDLRNNVHIRISKENEYMSDEYTIEFYNELITVMKKIDEQIFNNAIKLFGCN